MRPSDTAEDDNSIISGLRVGQSDAWLRLYDVYAVRLWRSVSRLMPNDTQAVGDIIQDSFMEAARSAKFFDASRGSIWQWLFGIARHRIARYYRHENQQGRFRVLRNWFTTNESFIWNWVNGVGELPESAQNAVELAELVQLTLSDISDEYAALLVARYFDGRTAVDIAKAENLSPDAVRQKLMRARRDFRREFMKRAQLGGRASTKGVL